jgi:hypothetical protein
MSAPSIWQLVKKNFVGLCVGLVFVPIGAVFVFTGIYLAREDSAFADRAITVEARIADKSLVKADFDKNPATRYLVHYRFASPTGTLIDETKAVSVGEWEHLTVGDTWRIRVLPGAELKTRTTPDSNIPGVVAFLALGLILLVVGTFVLILGVRETRRQWQRSRVDQL